MSDKNEWRWVPPVFIKGSPELVLATEQMWAETVSSYGGAPTNVATELWNAGWKLYQKYGKDTVMALIHDEAITIAPKSLASQVAEDYLRSEERKRFLKQLRGVFENLCDRSHESFLQYAATRGISQSDIDIILENNDRAGGTGNWKVDRLAIQERWFDSGILCDGKPHSTAEIKENAMRDGVLKDEDDWRAMKNLASDQGLPIPGARGYWQRMLKRSEVAK